jgi:peptidoglycan DL-endopeptidase CwlO
MIIFQTLLLLNIFLTSSMPLVSAESTNEVENVQQLNARIVKLNQEIETLEMKLNESHTTKTQIASVQAQIWEKKKQYDKIISLFEHDDHDANLEDIPASKTIGTGSVKQIITAGYQYIGNSVYVFGGGRNKKDIANGRFDCSSFVQWAYRQAGIEVGSTTDTLKKDGHQVSTSELRPGDLVFFDTYKKDGHVGIYLGGGKFIGSQSSTGVAIANMNSGYYQKKFSGHVRRIAN